MINQDSLFKAMIDAMKTHSSATSNIKWNNGKVRCFLFDDKWFPLRATINHARRLQGISAEATTDRCQSDLETLLNPLSPLLQDVPLMANQLTKATFAERIEGRKRKWAAINSLNATQLLIQQWV